MTADPAQIVLRVEGESLEWPEDTWRTDQAEKLKWFREIEEAVSYHNPWALLGQRPNGDVIVFDTSHSGVARCADWATRVWLLFPVEAYSG